jgi:POT family proton-dependent oligopeptide transporter
MAVNLQSQVGGLYMQGDRRRDDGFQIYYLLLNLGAFVAPIASGWIGQQWNWSAAFASAGFAMLIGLVIYVLGMRDLPADPPRPSRERL